MLKKRGRIMLHNTTTHYGFVAKFFHWGGALILIGLFAVAYIMMDMAPGDPKWAMYGYHKSFGLLALCWVTARYVWRDMQTQPDSTAPTPLLNIASQAMHYLLYMLMFAMPISGYVMSVAGGHDVFFFGIHVPSLIAKNPTLGRLAHEAHEYISFALMGCVALHVAAALWHHFKLRDNTLQRMVR